MARTLTVLVEPEVLRWARESIGLTPLAAARKIGLSDETLVDRWEAGAAAPSIPQLREAARVYKRPLAVFFLSRPPDGSFDVMHDFRRLPDAEARLWSPELHGEYRRAGPPSAMHDYGGVHPGPGVDVLTVLQRCPVTRADPGDVRNWLFRQLLSIAAGRRSR